MSFKNFLHRREVLSLMAIIVGTLFGILSMYLCIKLNLVIYGFNLYLIISPIVAGFVETKLTQDLSIKTTGAISSVILFIVTNFMGWVFPANPISLNIFTVGGFMIMLQAAFPLTINYLLFAFMLLFFYFLGRIGLIIQTLFNRKNKSVAVEDIELEDNMDVLVLNNEPDIPIVEYKGLLFAEDVIEFNEKNHEEVISYMASDSSEKNVLRHNDYIISRKYLLQKLQMQAIEIGANAIIDIEIEYTNYNQQLPPDMLMAVYGTAVIIDDKYLN